MELISQRIARGEEIRPRPRRQKQDKGKQKKSDEKEARTNAREEPDPWHDEVDWKRWGQRVIQMRLWGEQSVKWMVKGQVMMFLFLCYEVNVEKKTGRG